MSGPDWAVNDVEVRDAHTLRVWFEDGSIKDVDCTPLFSQRPFLPLQDEAFFRKAHTFTDTVEWEKDLDIAPEYLYEHGKDIN